VILRISGGVEVRYIDRTVKTETITIENSSTSQ
jgi:hypothetical protein